MDDNNQYGTKAVQQYLLPILVELDSICRRNNIRYSLIGGALLGTIRHGGFVPWDDDIDFIFDRENYKKFLEVIKKDLPGDYTVTGTIWVKRITKKDNPRLQYEEGCIDLFVFDNVPDNKVVNNIKQAVLKILQGMMKVKIEYSRYSFFHKICIFFTLVFGKLFTYDLKLKMYEKVSQIGNGKKSKYINNYVTYYDMLNLKYDAKLTSDYVDADFEGVKVMIFSDFDSALRTQFGDYHVLPPMEKRKPKHINVNT